MSDFEKALKFTLQFEGGYSNHKNDPGGPTQKGVTTKVYDKYRTAKGQGLQDVKLISDAELHDIYENQYWKPAGCAQLPWPLSVAVFDFAVNSGVGRAVMELQKCVGANADGGFGPDTLKAVMTFPLRDSLTPQYINARRAFFRLISTQKPALAVFLPGWLKRCDQLQAALSKPA